MLASCVKYKEIKTHSLENVEIKIRTWCSYGDPYRIASSVETATRTQSEKRSSAWGINVFHRVSSALLLVTGLQSLSETEAPPCLFSRPEREYRPLEVLPT